MRKRLAGLLICALVLGMMFASPLAVTTAEAAYGDVLGVDGTSLQLGGANITGPLFGVCDTTVLQFAIMSWINGDAAQAGKNQIFPNFAGTIPCSNSSDLWGKYFTLAEHYGLDLVRIGAGDKWGTDLQYNAWKDHHDQYIALLVSMADHAEAHGVKIILVLAGTQDYPAPSFGGTGCSFDTSSTAYANYIVYARDVMTHLKDAPGIGIIDMWNEPDHDQAYAKYWSGNGGKTAYHAWACDIASKTQAFNWHPRLIGVAGLGAMFSWGKTDFDLATGDVPFELNDRHYYAKIDHAYLFADPESWSDETGKPLIWTELGNNTNYPEERWPFAEQQIAAAGGQAFVAMTLLGTPNYPYVGEIVDTTVFPSTPVDPPEGPEDPPQDPGTGDETDPQDPPEDAPESGTVSPGTNKLVSKYAWSTPSKAVTRTSRSMSPALMVIPALGAAVILGSIMTPKKKRRRRRKR